MLPTPQIPAVVRFNRGFGVWLLMIILLGTVFFAGATLVHIGEAEFWLYLLILPIWPLLFLTIRFFQARKVVFDFGRGTVRTRGREIPFAAITSAMVWGTPRAGTWLVLFQGSKSVARVHIEGGLCRKATAEDWLAMRHFIAVKVQLHSRAPLGRYALPNGLVWSHRDETRSPIDALRAFDAQIAWMRHRDARLSTDTPYEAVTRRPILF